MKKLKINNSAYPKALKEIPNPPEKLYVEGNIENLYSPCLAVIGSRNCTEYGEKWCKYFVKELVKYGITIVSGMAIGIDSIAHKTALKHGGKTIAVLPCGLNKIYPKQNMNLYYKILKNDGTVITEYDSDTEADYNYFLERNRIVNGLSMGILVVEAAYRSGTSVTASIARKQNKKVFCIPHEVSNYHGVRDKQIIKKWSYTCN